MTSNTTTADDNNDNNDNHNNMKALRLSLWLLPQPGHGENLTQMIEEFSRHESASVPFPPHVTLVGGIPCPSKQHATDTLLPGLKAGLEKSSCQSIACQFSSTPLYNNKKWNQACVLVMEESSEFKELAQKCGQIALEDPGTPPGWYPPPVEEHPHMSLYYGEAEGAPAPEAVATGFEGASKVSFPASRIAIWINDPPTVQGVAHWEQLAVIDLPTAAAPPSVAANNNTKRSL